MGMGNTEGPMQRSDAVIMIIAVSIIAMMILTPTGLAVSVSYSATTTSASNSISASYFTVGAYSRNTFDPSTPSQCPDSEAFDQNSYTQINSPFLETVSVLYTKSGNNYKLTTNYTLTYSNCYLVIKNNGGPTGSYSVSFGDTIASEITTLFGTGMKIQYKLGSDSFKDIPNTSNMNCDTAYKFIVQVVFSYNKTTALPNDFSIEYLISTLRGIITGSLTGDQLIDLEKGDTSNDGIADIISENGLSSPSISYGGTTYNLTTPEGSYDGNDAVQISNSGNSSGGISDPSTGRVNLSFVIPEKKFYIAIKYNNDDGVTQQKFNLSLYMNGNEVFDGSVTLTGTGNGVAYIVGSNSWGDEGKQSTGKPGTGYNYWLGSNGYDTVDITIGAGSGNMYNLQPDTQFILVFKDSGGGW